MILDAGLDLASKKERMHTAAKIVVEDDVWIGANAVILSGVTLGKGSVIAAGAVVNKDVKSGTLVAGNPAKFIKEL
ncbi:hypothetical protein H5160_02905 [Pseudoalteromonas sp. SG43-4]|nr:hypothetical protein [Pseudoalteromonas sp. SG43-4]